MPRSAQAAVVPPGRDLRAADRRVVNFDAYVRECEAQVLDVTVVDLSEYGCRLGSEHQFEAETTIWLKIPGLVARKAKVVWANAAEAGCEFASPFHPAALEAAFSERPRKQLRLFF